MKKQWRMLKETIAEIRDNNKFDNEDVSSICKFLVNYMNILEKQMTNSENPNKWIPVSERLPEDYQRVLVTVVNYWGVEVVRVAEYHNSKRLFQIQENNDKWKVGEEGFLAWMPLPKPYREEEEKEE